jgi:hypothetical protein
MIRRRTRISAAIIELQLFATDNIANRNTLTFKVADIFLLVEWILD